MGKNIICEYNSVKHISLLTIRTYFDIFSLYSVQLPEVASQNETEGNFINMCGLATLQGKRGVHNLLDCERKMWHSMVPSGNVETTRSDVGRRGTDTLYVQGKIANHIHCCNALKNGIAGKHSWSTYGHTHFYEGIAIRKTQLKMSLNWESWETARTT
jgi:hypothetical protein